jgi:hypothetical protein
MSVKPYEAQLSKLGFSDKEARVYLASLELGPSPVQAIAQKAGVKRATTYVMIEALRDRGLVSTFEKGKKTMFVAESPERLMHILDQEGETIINKKRLLEDLMPDLVAFLRAAGDRPNILFYEGIEGLKAIHEDILRTNDKTLENIVALDDVLKVESSPDDVAVFRNSLHSKGIAIRILYSSKSKEIELPSRFSSWVVKKIPYEKMPLHGEITLYGDKVAAFSYRGKIFGTIIESKEIAQTIRVLFELAWASIK